MVILQAATDFVQKIDISVSNAKKERRLHARFLFVRGIQVASLDTKMPHLMSNRPLTQHSSFLWLFLALANPIVSQAIQ